MLSIEPWVLFASVGVAVTLSLLLFAKLRDLDVLLSGQIQIL